jgi:hypothetical protein
VETESPEAAELLRFTAFIAPDHIPYELLVSGSPKLGPVLSEALKGADEQPLKVNNLLKSLARYSLIRIDEVQKTIIPSCVPLHCQIGAFRCLAIIHVGENFFDAHCYRGSR